MEINQILADLEKNVGGGFSAQTALDQKQSDFERLTQAWISERTAPELLPYQETLLSNILDRLREQIEVIEMNSIELETQDQDIKLKLLIIENEIERVNFLVRLYLRCRLSKIDQFSLYINKNPAEQAKLSSSELAYMTKHMRLLLDLYTASFLKELPEHLRALDEASGDNSMITEPDLNKFVFVRVVSESARPIRFKEHEIELEKDDIHTIQYKYVKSHIKRGEVVLI